MILYWVTGGMWIFNDILAICSVIAAIKIFKIRSLKVALTLLFSSLLLEVAIGLFVHYVLGQSYNNLIIQAFESSLVIVFPSITPEFYRRCSWLPLTNLIFPGVMISYLRRFDKSRGTLLYLVIGYGSFYFGAIAWMLIDMNIRHATPMGLVIYPAMCIIVYIFAIRRNEMKTLWSGFFYDTELPSNNEKAVPLRNSDHYIAFQEIT